MGRAPMVKTSRRMPPTPVAAHFSTSRWSAVCADQAVQRARSGTRASRASNENPVVGLAKKPCQGCIWRVGNHESPETGQAKLAEAERHQRILSDVSRALLD